MVFPVVMYGCELDKEDVVHLYSGILLSHEEEENNAIYIPVVIYGCESWTVRRSNQSILKISPGCSLERMMLKLKLQYFGHLMRRVDSLEKTLMLGGIAGKRRG